MCTEDKGEEVTFVLSHVLTLGVPESFVLRKAPTRHITAHLIETSAPSEDFVATSCPTIRLFGAAPCMPRGLLEETVLPKGVGIFVRCEYLGCVPEGRRYGEKFLFSVTLHGRPKP